jgi:hypothetical protein
VKNGKALVNNSPTCSTAPETASLETSSTSGKLLPLFAFLEDNAYWGFVDADTDPPGTKETASKGTKSDGKPPFQRKSKTRKGGKTDNSTDEEQPHPFGKLP